MTRESLRTGVTLCAASGAAAGALAALAFTYALPKPLPRLEQKER